MFERNIEEHIFKLHRELKNKTYRHGPYAGFWIRDPKMRHIHKALVRDRVLHHAIFRILNLIFEPIFIPTSYSCRIGKGSHKGMKKVAYMLRKESRNNMRPCYALKCDIRKFFDSVDHDILFRMLEEKIKDKDTLWLLGEVIESFLLERTGDQPTLFTRRKGLPIGNLTSQLFANIYMNKFDHFIKHQLKVKYYARYTDDFVVVSSDRNYLVGLLEPIQEYLAKYLALQLHPKKVSIRKYQQGIDFLGYVVLRHHISLRTKTRRRMFRKLKERVRAHKSGLISEEALLGSLRSYLGVLSHATADQLRRELLNKFWFWVKE